VAEASGPRPQQAPVGPMSKLGSIPTRSKRADHTAREHTEEKPAAGAFKGIGASGSVTEAVADRPNDRAAGRSNHGAKDRSVPGVIPALHLQPHQGPSVDDACCRRIARAGTGWRGISTDKKGLGCGPDGDEQAPSKRFS